MKRNLLLMTDAYKQTHYRMLPRDLCTVYSYLESRGVSDKGVPAETLFFGLQMFLKEYLMGQVFTMSDVEEARVFCSSLFGADYFNYDGWCRLYLKYHGLLPIRIKAVPEGTVVNSNNVLVTVENTDREFPWLVNFLETILLSNVWYPTSVATTSYGIKKLLKKWAEKTSDSTFLQFHLNDFGYRGVSSIESAGIGGAAHLVNFWGTDNLQGIRYANEYYNADTNCDIVGMSVPASEHSATICWGKENEKRAYENFMKQYPNGIISIVSDSYDLYNAVDKIFGREMRDLISERDGKLVVRPDSGYPPLVTVQVLNLLDKHFGSSLNSKGYKVLNPKVGVIYGDFIKYGMIDDICISMEEAGFALENVVFGMGGALLQQVNRDTFKFAFKTSSVGFTDGSQAAVSKTPATDSGKNSKAGKLILVKKENNKFVTQEETSYNKDRDYLKTVFLDGHLKTTYDFKEIRTTSETFL